MLVHSVFFWARPDLTPAELAEFRAGIESLTAVKSAEAVYIGTPAAIPPRPVVDATYTFGLTVLFRDVAAHNAYQVDPVHVAFVQTFKPYWSRVQIYDAA